MLAFYNYSTRLAVVNLLDLSMY